MLTTSGQNSHLFVPCQYFAIMDKPGYNLRDRKRAKLKVKTVATKVIEETTGVAADAAASEVVEAVAPEIAEIVGDELVEVITEVGAESLILTAAEWITSEIFDAVISLLLGFFRLTTALYSDVRASGKPGISTFRAGLRFLLGAIGAYIGSIIGKFIGSLLGNGIDAIFWEEGAGGWGETICIIVFGILVAVAGRLSGVKIANKLIDRYKIIKKEKNENKIK